MITQTIPAVYNRYEKDITVFRCGNWYAVKGSLRLFYSDDNLLPGDDPEWMQRSNFHTWDKQFWSVRDLMKAVAFMDLPSTNFNWSEDHIHGNDIDRAFRAEELKKYDESR